MNDTSDRKRFGLSAASLALSLLGLFLFLPSYGLLPVLGVLFGHAARKKITAEPLIYGGKQMAMAGLIIGYTGLVVWTLLTIALLVYTSPTLFSH